MSKNAGYNDKNKFVGTLKTNFKYFLKGFDILGNNGYAITWNSKVNGLNYECVNGNGIKYITQEEFEQIKQFFLREKPQRARKPFLDILNGKIDIEDYSSTIDCEEFEYWKALFREVYHYYGLTPQEIYKGLQANQSSFDIEKTETQLQYHPYTEKPYTNDKLKKMFPEYTFGVLRAKKSFKKEEPETIDNFEIVDLILSKYHIKTIEESGEMVLYYNGFYERDKKRMIKSIIAEKLRELDQSYTRRRVNDILSLIENTTLVRMNSFDKDPYILNINNGLLNILTEEFKAHTPEYLNLRRIPLIYDPNVSCKDFDKFLSEIFHKEDIPFILEYIGLCLTPIMKFQIAVLLYGIGNNGKTTFLNLVQSFIGKENCSNIDISKFRNDSFFAQIENKLLNLVPDIDTETKINIQRFKDYVGNALVIMIKKLYKDPIKTHPTAKLIYSCNTTFPEIPKNTDKGFWRKWIFIETPYSFDKNENVNKFDELNNPNEFSGLLNKVIKSFQRLHKNGRFEPEYYDWEMIKDLWLENKNVVQEFIKENCIEEPNAFVIQKEFVNKINKWLKGKGRGSLYTGTITKKINSYPKYRQWTKRIGGKPTKIYEGFRFKKSEKLRLNNF